MLVWRARSAARSADEWSGAASGAELSASPRMAWTWASGSLGAASGSGLSASPMMVWTRASTTLGFPSVVAWTGLPVVGPDEGFDDDGGPVGSGVDGAPIVGGPVGSGVEGVGVVGLDEGRQSTTVASFMAELGMLYALLTILAST